MPHMQTQASGAPMRGAAEVYQWYIKNRKLQEGFRVPEEMLRSPNANNLITQLVQEKMGGIAGGFAAKKEDMAAAITKSEGI